MKLTLSIIKLDGGTQSRAFVDHDVVESYAEALASGVEFPPLVVFHDGASYWLADGFHRIHAMFRAGIPSSECEVRQGTQRDAILYACGANATHGKPRTNADKRRAVETLLRDEEWSRRSDNWIAQQCAVSNHFVGKMREESIWNVPNAPARRTQDGRSYPSKRSQPDPQPLNFDPDPPPRTEPPVVLEPVQREPEPATAPARTVSALDRFKDAFLTLFRVLPSPTQTAAKLWLKDWLEGGAS